MEDRFLRIVKWNPSYIGFLSGVFVSAAINVLTGITTLDKMPVKGNVLLIDFSLLFMAGVLLALFAVQLEDPYHHWKMNSSIPVNQNDLLREAMKKGRKGTIAATGIGALILGTAGVLLMLATIPPG